MKNVVLFITIFLTGISAWSQTCQVINQDSATSLTQVKADSGKTIVINFWASWCKPCLDELPYFAQAQANMDSTYQFISISLDNKKAKKSAEWLIKHYQIKGNHYLATLTNTNTFIENVDSRWQGSIPFTLVIKTNSKRVHEGSFDSYEQLHSLLTQEKL
jgi:thiol-disulfide isomerase/thioredoxin